MAGWQNMRWDFLYIFCLGLRANFRCGRRRQFDDLIQDGAKIRRLKIF
jgi:hypothetical protein